MTKKVLIGVLWGLAIWIVLTFLMGSIWGMIHSPSDTTTAFLSSNVLNLILLPPSLLLAIALVFKGQTQIIKKSLISIILALLIWLGVGILAVIAISLTGISHETARRSLHILNPILLGIIIVCSGYCRQFVDRTYDRLESLPEYGRDPQFLFSDSVGGWVVWNLFGHAPSTDEESQLGPVLGGMLVHSFMYWWKKA